MLTVNFPRQSNAADWMESIQLLSEDDNQPVWSTVPADLVVSISVKNETRRGFGDVQIPYISQQNNGPIPVLSATSTDGSGQLTAFDNGFIEIHFPASVMSNLVAGFYEVFITLKTEGITIQVINGLLPIVFGG